VAFNKKDPEQFWRRFSQLVSWYKPWETLNRCSFWPETKIEWFLGGVTNACYNCIDRHVEQGFGENTAITWLNSDITQNKNITFNDLLKDVQLFANVLKLRGIKKGDRVCI